KTVPKRNRLTYATPPSLRCLLLDDLRIGENIKMTTIKRLLNFGRKPSKPLLSDEDIAMNGTLRETLEAEVRAKARAEADVKAQIADLEAELKSNVAKCGTKAEKEALEKAFAA